MRRQRLLAERSFRDGKTSLRHGRMGQALEQLRRARDLHPEAIEYALYAAWVEFCHAVDPDEAAERQGDLEVLVHEALREDQDLAFAHYVQGQIALSDGNLELATRSFARAVKLDPSHEDAERHYVIARRRLEG